MQVGAIHEISQPSEFWFTLRSRSELDGVALRILLPNRDGTLAISLWEAGSVADVRALVDKTVGSYSKNGYFEVRTENAIGL